MSSRHELLVHPPRGKSYRYRLEKSIVRIGRVNNNDLMVEDKWLSRYHAEIRRKEDGEYYIADVGSQNGTRLNDERIETESRLQNHDLIVLGDTKIVFRFRRSSQRSSESDSLVVPVADLLPSHHGPQGPWIKS